MSNIHRSGIRAVREIANEYGVSIHIARIMYNRMNQNNYVPRRDVYDRYRYNGSGKRW